MRSQRGGQWATVGPMFVFSVIAMPYLGIALLIESAAVRVSRKPLHSQQADGDYR